MWATDALVSQERLLPGAAAAAARPHGRRRCSPSPPTATGRAAAPSARSRRLDALGRERAARSARAPRGAAAAGHVRAPTRASRACACSGSRPAARSGCCRARPATVVDGGARGRSPASPRSARSTPGRPLALRRRPRRRRRSAAPPEDGGRRRHRHEPPPRVHRRAAARRTPARRSRPTRTSPRTARCSTRSRTAAPTRRPSRGSRAIRSVSAPASPQVTQFPEHRPFAAIDGDTGTAWLADRALARPRHVLTVKLDAPRDVAARRPAPVRRLARRRASGVALNGERVRRAAAGGTASPVGGRVDEVRVADLEVSQPDGITGGAGGIRELRIPGVRATETLRPPVLAEQALRGTERAAHLPLLAHHGRRAAALRAAERAVPVLPRARPRRPRARSSPARSRRRARRRTPSTPGSSPGPYVARRRARPPAPARRGGAARDVVGPLPRARRRSAPRGVRRRPRRPRGSAPWLDRPQTLTLFGRPAVLGAAAEAAPAARGGAAADARARPGGRGRRRRRSTSAPTAPSSSRGRCAARGSTHRGRSTRAFPAGTTGAERQRRAVGIGEVLGVPKARGAAASGAAARSLRRRARRTRPAGRVALRVAGDVERPRRRPPAARRRLRPARAPGGRAGGPRRARRRSSSTTCGCAPEGAPAARRARRRARRSTPASRAAASATASASTSTSPAWLVVGESYNEGWRATLRRPRPRRADAAAGLRERLAGRAGVRGGRRRVGAEPLAAAGLHRLAARLPRAARARAAAGPRASGAPRCRGRSPDAPRDRWPLRRALLAGARRRRRPRVRLRDPRRASSSRRPSRSSSGAASRRGTLALAAGALLGIVVPDPLPRDLAARPAAATTRTTRVELIAAHWVGVGAVVLIGVALWRTVARR